MFREFLQRRKFQRTLDGLVTPQALDELNSKLTTFQPSPIEFVFAFVRGGTPAQVSERMSRVIELANTHRLLIHDVAGALVVGTFCTNPTAPPSATNRHSLIHALHQHLGTDIKAVHGSATGHYGFFGNRYTFLLPHFESALGALIRLQFGEIVEFQEPQAPSHSP